MTVQTEAMEEFDLQTPPAPAPEELETHIASYLDLLAEARTRAAQARQDQITAYQAWVDEHQPLFDACNAADERVSELEGIIRELALTRFEQTGSKKLVGGVGIRETRKIIYPDDKALEWAMQKGIALQLDRKEFEAVMKATTNRPDFVSEALVPTATIPSQIKVKGGAS